MKSYTFNAECLALAFISLSGVNQEELNPELTRNKLLNGLNDSPITSGKFDNLVWGPAIYRVDERRKEAGDRDDYMFFVVQNKNDLTDYRVAARSTVSALNSLEDVDIVQFDDWKKYDSTSPDGAKIAHGMSTVISDLLSIRSTFPADKESTLLEFLNDKLLDDDTLTFCGHSMGGTFSVPWGLSIKSKLQKDITVKVRSFAGATAGNDIFASHAEGVLGDNLLCIVNNKDVVPKAWNSESLKELETIYGDVAPLPAYLQNIIYFFSVFIADHKYTHAGKPEVFDPGVNPELTDFAQQYSYQHDDAYLDYHDLVMGVDIVYDVN